MFVFRLVNITHKINQQRMELQANKLFRRKNTYQNYLQLEHIKNSKRASERHKVYS